MPKKWGF